ncbi:MAG TPA: cysteine-rich CWC family protein [Parafilimonas sp.]|nr:cysteine-rich CWC family protein [Parafilimonas sp.]
MPLHEAKTCPRCNNTFECRAGDIVHCQCSGILLSVEESAFIEDRYQDCLCKDCLAQLKDRFVLFKEKFFFKGK